MSKKVFNNLERKIIREYVLDLELRPDIEELLENNLMTEEELIENRIITKEELKEELDKLRELEDVLLGLIIKIENEENF